MMTSPSARTALRVSKRLRSVASIELQAEIRTDVTQRALPPLIPDGWQQTHERGSRKLNWTRTTSSTSVAVHGLLNTTDFSAWDSSRTVCEWIPLTAVVSKPGCARRFRCEFGASNSKIKVMRVRIDTEPKILRPYAGPLMPECSEALSRCVSEYLGGCGVTSTFVEFACQAIHFAEHEMYLDWIDQLGRFASPLQPPQQSDLVRWSE